MSLAVKLGAGLVVLAAANRVSAAPEEPASVHASVTWLFGDDDALHSPSDVRPVSPGPAIGDRAGYDDLTTGLDSRFTGRENELVLGVGSSAPGFVRGLGTRADLALGFDLSGLGARPAALAVEDRGSALELSLSLGATESAPRLSLRLLPLAADRLRVGWLELLSWGGEVGPHRDSPYAAARTPPRGAVLHATAGPLRAELGLKTATFLEPVPAGPAVEEASYGAYGALELRSGALSVGVAAGRFEHGRLSGLTAPPRAVTTGASLRASLGDGIAEPRAPYGLGFEPLDAVLTATGQAAPSFTWIVGVEGVTLLERLRRFDEPGTSVLAPARAAALVGTLCAGRLEARAALAVRDPSFVMRGIPGVFEGLTLPEAAVSQVELLGVASAAVRASPWLEPGLSFGVRSPAAVMTASLDSLGQPTGATVVLYGPGDVELLPPGEGPVPVVETQLSLAVRWSRLLGATAFLGYRRDFNRTRLERKPGGAVARGFTDPNRLLYGLAARAVW